MPLESSSQHAELNDSTMYAPTQDSDASSGSISFDLGDSTDDDDATLLFGPSQQSSPSVSARFTELNVSEVPAILDLSNIDATDSDDDGDHDWYVIDTCVRRSPPSDEVDEPSPKRQRHP